MEPKRPNYMFINHSKCEFFPCHETEKPEDFNCLFCYCPLYALGDRCGGNFAYIDGGIKDCSNCLIPHSEGGYAYIMKMFPKVAELAKRD